MNEKEFYVGYLPKAPAGIARRMRATVAISFLIAIAGAIGFATVQGTFAPSVFEYGKERTFAGTLETGLYPTLRVLRPGSSDGRPQYSRYLLVAGGKHGADSQVAGFNGRSVRLRGALIYRDGQTMVELVPGSVLELQGTASPVEHSTNLGAAELTGEIVDSKCNFGVMNPGEGKVHKDCAVRCLSGGIPPAFVTRNFLGAPAVLLLTGPDGARLQKEVFLEVVGQPIRARGSVVKTGDTLLFEVEPGSIHALP